MATHPFVLAHACLILIKCQLAFAPLWALFEANLLPQTSHPTQDLPSWWVTLRDWCWLRVLCSLRVCCPLTQTHIR